MLQRTLPAGFIAPCLPTKTDKLPSGSQWLHEIKHDGGSIAVLETTSPAASRLSLEALARLRSRSCIIEWRMLGAHRPFGTLMQLHVP